MTVLASTLRQWIVRLPFWCVATAVAICGTSSRLIAQRGDADAVRRQIDTTFAFDTRGNIEIDAIGGSVRITGWNRSTIRVRVIGENGGTFELDADRSRVSLVQQEVRRGTVRYEISAPTGIRVRVASVDATIAVTSIAGTVSATSVSGAIDIAGPTRRSEIETVSGRVQVGGAPTDVNVTTVSGGVVVEGATGAVRVESVSGAVQLRGRPVRAEVSGVSGAISYEGSLNEKGRYTFESHSGGVQLTVAMPARVWLDVETYSGAVRVDVPNALRRPEASDDAKTRFRYTIGGGGARVRVESFSGRVTVGAR
jgi:DUF4097 and DUF4098 domain-containing protein YvlB